MGAEIKEKNVHLNSKVYNTTTVIALLLALGCFEHGLFETLQGFKSTQGYFIQAIGEEIRWWSGGTEGAFTIIPNYLITGILVIAISIFAAVWSVKYIKTKKGNLILVLSFIALTLLGGGIGHIPFYITAWAFTLKGRSSLKWLKKRIRNRGGLGKTIVFWRILLALISVLWLLAVEIAIFGYLPGVKEADVLLAICWGALLMVLLLIPVTYVAAMMINVKEEMT